MVQRNQWTDNNAVAKATARCATVCELSERYEFEKGRCGVREVLRPHAARWCVDSGGGWGAILKWAV